ncbi:SPOR domain-containing protein [Candidatus Omnitrophota bacterium]
MKNKTTLLKNVVHWFFLCLCFMYMSPSFAQQTGNGSSETSIGSHKKLFAMRTAHTYGKAHYSLGLQGLLGQREYFVFENNSYGVTKDNSLAAGIPFHVGITDYLDISAKIHVVHAVRPLKNAADVYQYHSSPESGIGASQAGIKVRFPFKPEKRFQIAGTLGAIFNTSANQIDGMFYTMTRKDGTDIEVSLLESLQLTSYMSLHLEQGYVVSGSDIFDDQIVLAAGLDVRPFRRLGFGLELYNRTFRGVSPQTVNKSTYYPFTFWDNYAQLGNSTLIKDNKSDFSEDYFVVAPSVYYAVNNYMTLHAGAAVNIAEQIGPEEPFQLGFGITFHGKIKSYIDTDNDGVNDKKDKEPGTPKGYPVDSFGVSRDTDNDGVPDGRDKEPKTPKGAQVNESGIAQDTDGDGVYDGIDKEPNTPKGCDVDENGVALDGDGDGVPDSFDKEPDTPQGYDVDERGVTRDDDGDGVPNAKDKEPNTLHGVKVDSNGAAIIEKKIEEKAKIEVLPFTIHVASYKNPTYADIEIQKYQKRGYEAFKIYTTVPGKGDWHRLFVGRYKTAKEALLEAKKIISLGYSDYTMLKRVK